MSFSTLLLTFIFLFTAVSASAATVPQTSDLKLTEQEKSFLAAHPVIRVGGPKAFPPFYYYDEQGRPQGIGASYVEILTQKLGVKVKHRPAAPWPEVLNGVRDRQLDLVGCIAKSTDREAFAEFSAAYLTMPIVIVTRTDAPFVSGLNTLQGWKMAIIRQVTTSSWLEKEKIKVEPVWRDTPLEALKAVSLGQADACIDNLASASYLIKKFGLLNLKIAAPTSWGEYQLSFAARKDWPLLISSMNKALATLTPEQHNDLLNRFMAVRFEHGVRREDIFHWVLLSGVPLALLTLAALYHNRRLRREVNERVRAQKETNQTNGSLKATMADLKRVEEALRRSESKFRSLFESSRDAVMLLDEDRFVDCNQATLEMFGCTHAEEFIGKGMEDFSPDIQPTGESSVSAIQKNVATAMAEGSVFFEWVYKKADGAEFPAEVRFGDVEVDGHTLLQALVRDISERKCMEKKLKLLALTDPLTGVDNRRSFLEKGKRELVRSLRYQHSLAFLMLDVDHFKAINDTYGHQAGDLVLQELTSHSQQVLRHNDMFGRLGGEEFALLLPETDLCKAKEVGERIRCALENLAVEYEGQTIRFTVSLGLSVLKGNSDTMIKVMSRADSALYQAKAEGRNRLVAG